MREEGRLRAMLTMARDAGFTFMRVWSGGLLEDQRFYRLCDELGIMLEQEMPVAGCGYAGTADEVTVASWRDQVPIIVGQVLNHPSLARYSMANEFYDNVSTSRVAAAYREVAAAIDPSRWARENDPNCVGQRHGPCAPLPAPVCMPCLTGACGERQTCSPRLAGGALAWADTKSLAAAVATSRSPTARSSPCAPAARATHSSGPSSG